MENKKTKFGHNFFSKDGWVSQIFPGHHGYCFGALEVLKMWTYLFLVGLVFFWEASPLPSVLNSLPMEDFHIVLRERGCSSRSWRTSISWRTIQATI